VKNRVPPGLMGHDSHYFFNSDRGGALENCRIIYTLGCLFN
jgi:hypothetical protein